jgi:hypothetical protein
LSNYVGRISIGDENTENGLDPYDSLYQYFLKFPATYPFSDGKIYAMMVVNRTMSDSEVLEMSNYFRDKFNF